MLGGACGDVADGASQAELAAAEARVTQTMIDVSADRLEGLRTQCATSAELTQQEIRTLEGKLMKLFSRQLVAKNRFAAQLPAEFRNLPRLSQWLRVVGLSPDSIQAVCGKMSSVEALKESSEHEMRALLSAAREEEVRRLCRAMFILKKYTDALLRGEYAGGDGPSMQLYWDSWDRHHLRGGSPRARTRNQRASVPGEEALAAAPMPGAASSPPSPLPASTLRRRVGTSGLAGGGKLPTTPVLSRRGRTNNLAAQEPAPLTKSRSHESQLAASHRHPSDLSDNSQTSAAGLPEASPPASPAYDAHHAPHAHHAQPSDDATPHHRPTPIPNNTVSQSMSGSLSVPRSPRTPTVARGMAHDIAHRFTKSFNMIATCDFCDKQMLFGSGLKCKECKFKCHRECEPKVPPSCGLPPEFVVVFKEQLANHALSGSGSYPALTSNSPVSMLSSYPALSNNSPLSVRGGGGGSPAHGFLSSFTHHRTKRHRHQPNVPAFPGGPDSSSASSCNSSTPSSPALAGAAAGAGGGAPATPRTPHLHQHAKQQFHFPEVKSSVGGGGGGAGVGVSPARHAPHHERHDEVTASVRSGDSSRPASLSGSASTDSERAARADSMEEGGANTHAADSRWPRQNSLSMKEWDIPYDELRLFEVLGAGRFGTVYRGSWHGAVAVKLLNVQYLHDDGGALDNFKHEVATFRKTRHENLVLFMGACMKPPKLAIVTSLCKGMTLYTHIHLHKDKFNANKSAMVAQQIAQGMGYLHARGIVHKDLKSKNIFLENGKVVITDFGLFSVTKLCFWNNARGDSLGIPAGWLCYLAPELVRALRPHASVHLPFSKASDVYAFGTVWYELLCGEWPFKGQPPEAVIWQVGKGIKQTLSTLQSSRDVKDILMLCWAYRASERPDFARLLSTLEKLPRKRLARSPSHPVHLSRSAESVF